MSDTVFTLYDDQLYIFVLEANDRDAISEWRNAILETLKDWPPYLPVVVLLDLGSHDVMLTPYLRVALDQITSRLKMLRGRFALCIANTLNGQMIRLNHHRYHDPHFTMLSRIFQDYDESIQWLERGLI
jgi:hypothetical protein